ncbi:hypothetical protein [Reyranella sp.]|uniref:hypothetical protein n=1 Tax=Reyranella sp. TaxID=1929291 RepID=UPI003D0BC470
MEGTFDDPPIVMWQDRVKVSLMSLVTAGLAALFYWLCPASDASLFWSVLLGLVAAVLGWIAIARSGLIAAPEGLTWRTGFRTFNYEWSDFERFTVVSGRSNMVVGVLSERCNRRRRWFLRWMDSRTFGAVWELPPQRIVDILNEALTRWGPPRPAS